MSRIGKQPVALDGAKVTVQGRDVTVEAGGNKLSMTHRREVTVRVDEQAGQVVIERSSDDRTSRAMHGLTRSLINNMVIGVTKGFSKELEIVGVGWNAKVQGTAVNLNVGYADTRTVAIGPNVKVEVEGQRIKVTGPDKQAVGQTAAEIRSHRPPEPYNGKGIKYSDERVVRKQGKAFVGSGA
jgi:large subunit ribosomal protein L6